MRHIYVLVEGHSEREFVSRILAPFLINQNVIITPVPMRKSGGGMGFSNLEHFKNHIEPLLAHKDSPVITTFTDLFRFPNKSSNHTETQQLKEISQISNIEDRIKQYENFLFEIVQKIKPYKHFLPYIQKHEFEALLFCDSEAYAIENEAIQKDIAEVIAKFPNPEDINTTVNGHPAQRLTDIYAAHNAKYEKGADAVDIAELIGIEVILEKCPRFRQWITALLTLTNQP